MSLSSQHRKLLFSSLGVGVVDFRCHAHAEPDAVEEPNLTHSITFIRRGVFRMTYRGERFLADPTCVLFSNKDDLNRYAHPFAGGDDCTILTVETPRALELVARHSPRDAERPETPFRLHDGVCSRRAAQLHYELLARVRRLPLLAAEDVLAELTDQVVADAYRDDARATRGKPHSAARRRNRDLVEAVKLELNARLDCPPSLGELARSLGAPRSTSREHSIASRA